MQDQDKQREHDLQREGSNKVMRWVASAVGIILALLVIGGGIYTVYALQPANRHDENVVSVHIPEGATNDEIAGILKKDGLIRNISIFKMWLKTHSVAGFQAGDFYVSPSMNNRQIVSQLQGGGGRPVVGHVLVKEGQTIDEIGNTIAKNTKYSKKDFLALMKNEKFLKSLEKRYPQLLSSSMKKNNVRYHLEGYLFPAKYDVYQGASLDELVTQMVEKENEVLTPYYSAIKKKHLTVQEVLTLASLVEREGVKDTDRRKIAGVFFNRLDAGMPLQSDISVMYALNKHKHSLSLKDVKVKSPYNLYVHKGYGPGPFNNPSLNSISAVLNPLDRDEDYLYFVANLKTGEVKFSHTLDEHEANNASFGQ
ncbi:endolytic transglycosylase MltG [Lactobacillus sp. PV034]|uniref:endolytic transglycosylase MltG n=1 Tax=Lactobacillus sp. PV034 TaxID=2594495 RepID=UPI0022407450|nr:endolytic transglycosylase MltG [Lactobacillus sp. PV034]QNQ80181.1 endolytic transglycosylase MltG [Lactobacillus sp. PV034]